MTSAPKRISIPAMLAYTGVLAAMLYLLYFQLASDAPMRNGRPSSMNSMLTQVNSIVATTADGRAVAYHVNATPQEWADSGRFFTTFYYSAVYSQYPNRVWVGDGSTVINFPADLQQADKLQSDQWLHAHQIPAVVALLPGDPSGPKWLIHRVP